MPEWLKQQIAFTWVVSATSRAATVIASETPERRGGALRLDHLAVDLVVLHRLGDVVHRRRPPATG